MTGELVVEFVITAYLDFDGLVGFDYRLGASLSRRGVATVTGAGNAGWAVRHTDAPASQDAAQSERVV